MVKACAHAAMDFRYLPIIYFCGVCLAISSCVDRHGGNGQILKEQLGSHFVSQIRNISVWERAGREWTVVAYFEAEKSVVFELVQRRNLRPVDSLRLETELRYGLAGRLKRPGIPDVATLGNVSVFEGIEEHSGVSQYFFVSEENKGVICLLERL